MKDVAIELDHRPGALAAMGRALGAAGVSIEGGGVWVVGGRAFGHFLFADGAAARAVLEAAGIRVIEVRDVLLQRLRQDVPGQLGELAMRMAQAGVNIEVQYSDHEHRLVLVVDDAARGRAVSESWSREQDSHGSTGPMAQPEGEHDSGARRRGITGETRRLSRMPAASVSIRPASGRQWIRAGCGPAPTPEAGR